MVLARTELVPGRAALQGRRHRAATEWNGLCRGNLDRMVTDTRMLLIEGLKLAQQDLRRRARWRWAGWSTRSTSSSSTRSARCTPQAFVKAFGIDPKKVLTIFHEHGNIGPASVPIVLTKLREMGRLKKGNRVALLGIGSGLNCSMAEVVW